MRRYAPIYHTICPIGGHKKGLSGRVTAPLSKIWLHFCPLKNHLMLVNLKVAITLLSKLLSLVQLGGTAS
jgi:hypothetical protein